MTVVSDTSPLNYLILINCEGLLNVLFRKIALPAAVLTELQSEGAPKEIHDWITHKPDWIGVHHVDMPETYLRNSVLVNDKRSISPEASARMHC